MSLITKIVTPIVVPTVGVGVIVPAFIFEVKTTAPGETFKPPTELPGTYNGNIDWGDDSNDDITAYDQAELTHTYAIAGTYIVTITGIFYGWSFNNLGDKSLIGEIKSWGFGVFRLGSSGGYFYGCNNMTVANNAGVLDLTDTFDTSNAFALTALMTQLNMTGWVTGHITNWNSTFPQSGLISIDLRQISSASMDQANDMFFLCGSITEIHAEEMDISNLTTASNFLFLTTITTTDYSNLWIGWFGSGTHQNNVTFHGGGATYSLEAVLYRNIALADGWTIQDNGPQSLGAELVVNGGFDVDTDWVKVGSTISGGKLNIDGTSGTSLAQQLGVMESGKIYHITADILVTSGSMRISGITPLPIFTANESYFADVVAGDTKLQLTSHVNGVGTFDNVSVKEIL